MRLGHKPVIERTLVCWVRWSLSYMTCFEVIIEVVGIAYLWVTLLLSGLPQQQSARDRRCVVLNIWFGFGFIKGAAGPSNKEGVCVWKDKRLCKVNRGSGYSNYVILFLLDLLRPSLLSPNDKSALLSAPKFFLLQLIIVPKSEAQSKIFIGCDEKIR